MTAALEGSEWSAVRPGRSLPPGKTRYPIYKRLGGPQGRSGQAENLGPHRDSIPDRPARQSLYRLSWWAHSIWQGRRIKHSINRHYSNLILLTNAWWRVLGGQWLESNMLMRNGTLKLAVVPQVEAKGSSFPWPPLEAALSISNVHFFLLNSFLRRS